jgi:nucleoid DNA-binding protein
VSVVEKSIPVFKTGKEMRKRLNIELPHASEPELTS